MKKEIPTAEQLVAKRLKQLKSKYPLRDLGLTLDGSLYISEEERESHLHILGTTGEGKSRFIEHLIRGDIKQGKGVCFLDPTDRAETAYNVLKYCASIGFEKVCLIDPHTLHTHGRITAIQPFHRAKSYKQATVSNVFDTIRTVGQTNDASEIQRIKRNLPATLSVLWNAGMTLHEAVYFSDFINPAYRLRRNFILEKSHNLDRHRLIIENAFKTHTQWTNFYQSTVNRLEDYFDSTLDLMFGASTGVNFTKMITEGWVILVNLYSGLGFEPIQTRLLGTSIINEIIFALDRLRSNGWKGVYYLYVDEAGRYANRNLAELLAYKRKSGLRVTVAHQYFKQFEDTHVLDAVKNLAKIKVMFNTPNHADRLEMVKALGYGGDIPPMMAAYANSDLPKQYAIIKSAKQAPVRVKIPDVPDAKISKQAEETFINKCLSYDWNYTPKEVRQQMNDRFRTETVHTPSPSKRTLPDRKAVSDTPKTKRKSLLDIKD